MAMPRLAADCARPRTGASSLGTPSPTSTTRFRPLGFEVLGDLSMPAASPPARSVVPSAFIAATSTRAFFRLDASSTVLASSTSVLDPKATTASRSPSLSMSRRARLAAPRVLDWLALHRAGGVDHQGEVDDRPLRVLHVLGPDVELREDLGGAIGADVLVVEGRLERDDTGVGGWPHAPLAPHPARAKSASIATRMGKRSMEKTSSPGGSPGAEALDARSRESI